MRTVFAEISGYLNSRPLVPLYVNEVGASALTPGHFLVGGPIVAPPTNDMTFQNVSHLKRWQLMKELTASIWNEWSKEHVTQLFNRLQWKNPVQNVKIDNIDKIDSIVKHETICRTKWPMARVIQTFPGKDGLVRSVELLMHGSVIRRPIQKLCILPVNEEIESRKRAPSDELMSQEKPPAKRSKPDQRIDHQPIENDE